MGPQKRDREFVYIDLFLFCVCFGSCSFFLLLSSFFSLISLSSFSSLSSLSSLSCGPWVNEFNAQGPARMADATYHAAATYHAKGRSGGEREFT